MVQRGRWCNQGRAVQREESGATKEGCNERTVVQQGKGGTTRGEWCNERTVVQPGKGGTTKEGCNEGRAVQREDGGARAVQREESGATREGGGSRTTVATD